MNYKGYPGDGDSSVELEHADPSKWTSRQTWISLVIVMSAIVVSFVLVATLYE